MLSRSVDVLPTEGPWAYEPKLDGFRCLLSIKEFGDVRLDSRRAKPLGRYFPEIVTAAHFLPSGLVLDGELVIAGDGGVDFSALQQRLRYSSPARTSQLASEMPASLVAFDVLERDGHDLRRSLYDERRQVLEVVLSEAPRAVGLMPMTTDPEAAGAWLRDQPPGIEGVVAKRRDQRYRPGARSWQKLRARDTAEAVIGGIFGTLEHPEALVLGRYRGGRLRVVGRTSPLPLAARAELQRLLRSPRTEHPWPLRLPSSRFGQTPGSEIEYTQVEPELAVEVETDTAYEQGRWRHATKYLRLRPDLAPEDVAADSA
ncbi:ATP-dependent DNA ligase [Actinomycetospora chibensis]